jgi:hypothetical protein
MKLKTLHAFTVIAILLGIGLGVGHSTNALVPSALFGPYTQNTIPKVVGYSSGYPVYGDSLLTDDGSELLYNGNPISGTYTLPSSVTSLRGTGTFTTATADTFTLTGATSSSNCTFSPTNATAAASTVIGYISAVATNSVTITHVATTASGGTVNIHCTVN